jgi:hypothetical protein
MMPGSMPVPGRCKDGRARGVTPRVLTLPHWRAALRRSSGRILPGRSRCWRRWWAKTNALAAARTARLIEFTLLRAYIEANRLQEAKPLLEIRGPGASGVPVVGIAAVH